MTVGRVTANARIGIAATTNSPGLAGRRVPWQAAPRAGSPVTRSSGGVRLFPNSGFRETWVSQILEKRPRPVGCEAIPPSTCSRSKAERLISPHAANLPRMQSVVAQRTMDMPFDALSEVSDEALLVAFGNGDRAAAQALTARLSPRVLGYSARMLGDRAEAEDVTQEAMLRLWRQAPDWRQGEAQVSTWLFRVTANLCTDRLRKRKHRGEALDTVAEPEDPAPGVEASMQTRVRADALEAALMDLPERQRQAVVLRHLEGFSNPEIAEVMDIGVEAVESLTARGKRALAARLAPKRAELGYDDDR